jgi:hypothetical protein
MRAGDRSSALWWQFPIVGSLAPWLRRIFIDAVCNFHVCCIDLWDLFGQFMLFFSWE